MNINKAKILIYIKYVSILAMSFFYIRIGIQHFTNPVDPFLHIIPPALKSIGLELVYISGYFEIVLGVLLLIPKTRKIAAYGLILLLIAVYPANLYLAFYELPKIKTVLPNSPFKFFSTALTIFLEYTNKGDPSSVQIFYSFLLICEV